MSQKVYEIVTNQIIEILESGTIPWHLPWRQNNQPHCNFISKKVYRGINPFILNCKAMQCGFESNFWLSKKQVKTLGGEIKEEEKGNSTIIIFWKWLKLINKEDEENEKMIPLLRYYRVFNLDQTDLREDLETTSEVSNVTSEDSIDVCEAIVDGYKNKPEIFYKGEQAYYIPSTDEVHIPSKEKFEKLESFYSILFHELAHSTGHKNRLNRSGIEGNNHSFGDSVYSKEELIAEMTSSFLCALSGIETQTIQNSASYIESWLKVLKSDHKILIISAAQAQKAADYITNQGAYGPLFFSPNFLILNLVTINVIDIYMLVRS